MTLEFKVGDRVKVAYLLPAHIRKGRINTTDTYIIKAVDPNTSDIPYLLVDTWVYTNQVYKPNETIVSSKMTGIDGHSWYQADIGLTCVADTRMIFSDGTTEWTPEEYLEGAIAMYDLMKKDGL